MGSVKHPASSARTTPPLEGLPFRPHGVLRDGLRRDPMSHWWLVNQMSLEHRPLAVCAGTGAYMYAICRLRDEGYIP